MAQPDPSVRPVEPDQGPDGHRYNDDLLLDDANRRAEYDQCPAVTAVLDFPELREVFVPIDKEANRAKRASQAWGFWAVVMALLSLLGGSSEAVWGLLEEPWPVLIAGLSGLLGLLAVLVAGFGVLYGSRKRAWLRNRLRTERLRQLHFQVFLTHFSRIVALVSEAREGKPKSDASLAAYKVVRATELEAFLQGRGKAGDEGKSPWREQLDEELEAIIASDARRPPPIWLLGDKKEPHFPEESCDIVALNATFKAYANVRISEQIKFAEYTLRRRNERSATPPPQPVPKTRAQLQRWPWFPGMRQPLRVWRRNLSISWRCSFFILVALHVYLVFSALFYPEWVKTTGFCMHVGVIWAALVAVAAKTLAEGLAVNREVQRYEEYLAVCSELGRDFRAEGTSPARKFELMVRMERTSFEEMREFLRSNDEASFVL